MVNINLSLGQTKKININIDVMVIPHLADEFLIGSDILNSSLVIQTTPKEIKFKCPKTKVVVNEPFKITYFPIQPLKLQRMGKSWNKPLAYQNNLATLLR
jgi:hypothetical protein